MTVVELGPRDEGRWVELLSRTAEATLFHHPAWVRALRAAHGYHAVVLAHEDPSGDLDAVLPLMCKRGLLTGRQLVSLPHTPVAGPVGAPPACRRLAEAALDRARDEDARLVLKTRAQAPCAGARGLEAVTWSTTFVLTLPDDPDGLRFGSPRNHRRVRWAARKAAKAGVTVRAASTIDDVRRWYGLYLETMREQAVPPRPLRFFTALWEHLAPEGMLRLLLAEHDRRLLAGSLFLSFQRTVFYAYNGRHREDLGLRPNDLLQWHAIHAAVAAGVRRYDFGEVEDAQHGLAEFKSKWGAEPEPLVRHIDRPCRTRITASQLERARHWGEAAWQRVPLSATARIGDAVYRRL